MGDFEADVATRIELQAVRFRACCSATHVDKRLSGSCGDECHADQYHPECPACHLVEDHGTLAYYHKNPLRRLWWRVFHVAT